MRGRKTSASDTNAYNQSNPQLAERFNVSVPLTVTWLIVPTSAPFRPRYSLSSSEPPQSGLYGFNSETSSFSASPFLKVFRSQPLLFVCVCRCTLPPTVSECAHEEASADMSAKQQRERDVQKERKDPNHISFVPESWTLFPRLFHLRHLRSSERRSEGPTGLTASRGAVTAGRRRSAPPRGPAC